MEFDKYIEAEKKRLDAQRLEYDIYEKNKIEWLKDNENNGYISDKTKKTYYNLLSSHVHSLEVAKGKDLNRFTSIEIESLIKSSITNNRYTKRSIYSAINNYLIYCTERGIISYNQCDGMSKENLFIVNAKALQKQYMPLDDFYKFINKLEGTDVEKMAFILIRYGVPVKQVPLVKWEDLDENNLVLNVNVKGVEKQLPIDEEFIRRVDLAKKCSDDVDDEDNRKKLSYIDAGYMIKSKREAKKISATTVYTIVENVCRDSDIERIDLGMLYKNRRYDFAIDIYEEKNELTTDNLREILDVLGVSCSPNRVTTFKSELKNIFDIDVEVAGRVSIDVVNFETGEVLETYPSIKALSEDSKQKFGFYIDKSIVSKIAKGEREEYKGLTFVKK